MIPFSRPYEVDWTEVGPDIEEIISTGLFTKGKWVKEFERQVAEKFDIDSWNVVTFGSGLAALLVALKTYEKLYKKIDLLYLPEFTYPAVPETLQNFGYTVWDTDVNGDTWTMEPPETVSLTRHTLFMPMDTFGNRAYIKECDVPQIYDACQSFGADWDIRGLAEVYSLNGAKVATSGGEGGLLVTRDIWFSKIARNLRDLFSRMTEIQARLGLYNLEHIDDIIARKKTIHDYYRKHLEGWIHFQKITKSNYYIFGMLSARRDMLINEWKGMIDFRDFYNLPHPYHRGTKRLSKNMLCLPNPSLSEAMEVTQIVNRRVTNLS